MQDSLDARAIPLTQSITKPSSAYKARAWFAVCCLVLFITSYLSLLAVFGWQSYVYWFEAIQGGDRAFIYGLIAIGCSFITLFLAKGLWFYQMTAINGKVEINRTEQPELFAFIDDLAEQVGAPKAHRVFLSPSVNACVFYDFSIFNLLFSSKKNLEIGLGLVNVLSLSEFKAVLAHEFGHFAQRTMAIGSWVYIAGQIADQIVNKRDALDRFLQTISRWDIRVAWIGWILSLVVWSLRAAIDVVLRLVVLAQRSLSRQMEFQADLVAVALTGSDELIHALHKLNAADDAWDRTLHFTATQLQQGKRPGDVFAIQHYYLQTFSRLLSEPHYFNPPSVPDAHPELHRIFKKSIASAPKMWASHPSNTDRENNAKQTYIAAQHDSRSAWSLFQQAEQLQQQLLTQLFNSAEASMLTADQTEALLSAAYNQEKFNPRYRGLYLDRYLTQFEALAEQLTEPELNIGQAMQLLPELYNDEHIAALHSWQRLHNELAQLTALNQRRADSPDSRIVFRGEQIKRSKLGKLIKQVRAEFDVIQQQLYDQDKQVRVVHLALARKLGQSWDAYLLGLLHLLHFAEHTQRNLADANKQLLNMYQYVTADGKVSKREFQQLMDVASATFWVLRDIHLYKQKIKLDAEIVHLLGAEWSQYLAEFQLPPPSDDNLADWLAANEDWARHTHQALGNLVNAALQRLLLCEHQVAEAVQDNRTLPAAPQPSVIATDYPVLMAGAERPLKLKLSLWDRFILADGAVATIARSAIAFAMVGAIISLLFIGASKYQVYLVNGLAVPVEVQNGTETIVVAPQHALRTELVLDDRSEIIVRSIDGTQQIDRVMPKLAGHGQDYVYNIASASVLTQWSAVYGDAQAQPPTYYGTTQWFHNSADYKFIAPPSSYHGKGKGARLEVLEATLKQPVAQILAATPENQRSALIQVHQQWEQGSRLREWQHAAVPQ